MAVRHIIRSMATEANGETTTLCHRTGDVLLEDSENQPTCKLCLREWAHDEARYRDTDKDAWRLPMFLWRQSGCDSFNWEHSKAHRERCLGRGDDALIAELRKVHAALCWHWGKSLPAIAS